MAKSKVKSLPQGEMEENNKKWFDEYIEHHHPEGYNSLVERFLRFSDFQNRPFDTFVIDDLDRYKRILEVSGRRSGNDFYAIKNFRNFLRDKYQKQFGETFLPNLSRFIPRTQKSKTNGMVLSLPQISYIRKYNKSDIYDEYVFEVLFQLGVQKEYLKFCLPVYADPANRLFVLKGKKEPIPYNDKIETLLSKIKDAKKLEDKIKKINHQYFYKITDYLRDDIKIFPENRKLNSSDILVSHQAYFFTCPNCGDKFENIAENWILAKMEVDNQNRLFCTQCKGVPNGN